MVRSLALPALIAALGGCSALATITISRSTPNASTCSTSPAPVAIDFALATIGAAAAVGTGHVDAWLIIPGVFALSGVVGTITTYGCRHRGHTGPAEHAKGPPPSDAPPPSTDAPLDPDARDATPGELGVTTVPVAPLPAPTAAPPVDPGACSIEPTVTCPDGQSCLLEDGNRGHCVADH